MHLRTRQPPIRQMTARSLRRFAPENFPTTRRASSLGFVWRVFASRFQIYKFAANVRSGLGFVWRICNSRLRSPYCLRFITYRLLTSAFYLLCTVPALGFVRRVFASSSTPAYCPRVAGSGWLRLVDSRRVTSARIFSSREFQTTPGAPCAQYAQSLQQSSCRSALMTGFLPGCGWNVPKHRAKRLPRIILHVPYDRSSIGESRQSRHHQAQQLTASIGELIGCASRCCARSAATHDPNPRPPGGDKAISDRHSQRPVSLGLPRRDGSSCGATCR